mgnify:FL=1
MWIVMALIGALFTSLTTIFAKVGIKNVNSNFATFFRTGVVIIFAVIMCFITNSFALFNSLTTSNWLFLILSGIVTGLSWLCYYRAIKLGDVSKVAPIDKSSFILTSILFLIFFFNDTTNNGNLLTLVMLFLSMALMLAGTLLMIGKVESKNKKIDKKWLLYAILSAVFASLVSLFVKIGLKDISSSLGTCIRTIVVFIFAMIIVLARKDYQEVNEITSKSWIFLTLSGIATGVAWISEYEALNYVGANPVAVTSISKLAILLTMMISILFLHEKFTLRSFIGLALMTLGIVLIIIFSL